LAYERNELCEPMVTSRFHLGQRRSGGGIRLPGALAWPASVRMLPELRAQCFHCVPRCVSLTQDVDGSHSRCVGPVELPKRLVVIEGQEKPEFERTPTGDAELNQDQASPSGRSAVAMRANRELVANAVEVIPPKLLLELAAAVCSWPPLDRELEGIAQTLVAATSCPTMTFAVAGSAYEQAGATVAGSGQKFSKRPDKVMVVREIFRRARHPGL